VRKKQKQTTPPGKNTNRLLLRRWARGPSGPDRLWDRSGKLWELAAERLDEARVRDLFFDPAVPVATYEGAGALRWVEPDERRRDWPAVQRRTFDDAWPAGAPGTRRFVAQEWRSGDSSLLLFDDFD
jgi:hypothetical protein